MNRIALGVNDSPQLKSLMSESLVSVEWIKYSDCNEYEAQEQSTFLKSPPLIHFFPRISYNELPEEWTFKKLNQTLIKHKVPHISIPLRASKNDFDKLPKPLEAIELYKRRIRELKSELKVPILLKNMPSSALPEGLKYMADAEWIATLCREANVDFLLDMAHARISAYDRQENILDYLGKLPIENIEEIHMSGIKRSAGKWIDAHECLEETDLELLKTVMIQKHPKIVVLDYDHIHRNYGSDQIQMNLLKSLQNMRETIDQTASLRRTQGNNSFLLSAVR